MKFTMDIPDDQYLKILQKLKIVLNDSPPPPELQFLYEKMAESYSSGACYINQVELSLSDTSYLRVRLRSSIRSFTSASQWASDKDSTTPVASGNKFIQMCPQWIPKTQTARDQGPGLIPKTPSTSGSDPGLFHLSFCHLRSS